MMSLRLGELTGRPVRFMNDEEHVEAFYTMTTYRLVCTVSFLFYFNLTEVSLTNDGNPL